MKASKFVRFLRNGLFLALITSLLLIVFFVGSAQEELKVLRQTNMWPCYIDPAVGSDGGTSSIALCNLYDVLVFPNVDGSMKPWLAKSWTVTEDGLTMTFELVPGVKFHNGDELTADDVVFSLERIMTIGEGYGYIFLTIFEGAEALEKYKVQFNLKDKFGPALGALAKLLILNEKQVMENIQDGPYGEFGDYGKEWLNNNDAGSGPYKVKEMRTGEYLLMEKFDDYWVGWENKDAPQYVKQIATTEAILVRTLISRGELEITDCWQSPENLDTIIDQVPNTEVSNLYESSVLNIILNNKKPPTDCIHFRKALAYSIDYQQIIDLFPGCRPSGPVAPSTPGHHPNLKLYNLDLEKAEEELKKSIYYGKLDQYPFEINWVSEGPAREKIALMFQANAAKLGIKVNIVKIPWLSLIERMSKPETTPNGAIVSISPQFPEAGSMLLSRYHSSSCGTWQAGEWLQEPEIDAMIEDSLSTIDQTERFQKYYEIQEKLVDLCPTIWLYELCNRAAYRNDYVFFPAAEAIKQGGLGNPVKEFNFYFRDFKVFPEKAKEPYTPFKP